MPSSPCSLPVLTCPRRSRTRGGRSRPPEIARTSPTWFATYNVLVPCRGASATGLSSAEVISVRRIFAAAKSGVVAGAIVDDGADVVVVAALVVAGRVPWDSGTFDVLELLQAANPIAGAVAAAMTSSLRTGRA